MQPSPSSDSASRANVPSSRTRVNPFASTRWPVWMCRTAVGMLTTLLLACGGGELLLLAIPGVGTGGTGIVLGTLTGLGSVVIDGVRYEDSQATLASEQNLLTTQTLLTSDLAIGQQVSIELDSAGAAKRVEVVPQVVGPVQSIGTQTGRMVVWGQTVTILTSLTSSQGIPTVLSGYAQWQEIQPQDLIRVYGIRAADPLDKSASVLQATRIEKLLTLPDELARATGVLQRDATQNWMLGGLTLDLRGAQVLPNATQLEAGDWVTATGAWQASSRVTTNSPWQVSALKSWRASQPENTPLQLQGTWQAASAKLVTAQGLEVDLSNAGLIDQVRTLSDGAWIRIEGQINHDKGVVVASKMSQIPNAVTPVELKGSITSWVSAQSFAVRSTPIDGASATWEDAQPQRSIGNGRYAEVSGTFQNGVIRATRIKLGDWPDKAVVDVAGTVLSTNPTASTFVFQLPQGPVEVSTNGAALPAAGSTVQVQGYWLNGQIRPDQILTVDPSASDAMDLEGVVSSVNAAYFSLNGIDIWVPAESAPPLKTWFAQLVAGSRVRVRAVQMNNRHTLVGLPNSTPLPSQPHTQPSSPPANASTPANPPSTSQTPPTDTPPLRAAAPVL